MWNENGFIEKFKAGQHLILTGGSPLKQQGALTALIEMFIGRYGFKPYIEVENETVLMPNAEFAKYVDCWNNSPKLANSTMKIRVRYKPDIISATAALPNSWFKFVIAAESDWDEIEENFLKPGLIRKDQIVVMPEGQTREELQPHYDIAVNMAVKHNIRFSDRMHITIWNKKVGV
jgi:organic radical activating enzyme